MKGSKYADLDGTSSISLNSISKVVFPFPLLITLFSSPVGLIVSRPHYFFSELSIKLLIASIVLPSPSRQLHFDFQSEPEKTKGLDHLVPPPRCSAKRTKRAEWIYTSQVYFA